MYKNLNASIIPYNKGPAKYVRTALVYVRFLE
jgi:hypothetical protein